MHSENKDTLTVNNTIPEEMGVAIAQTDNRNWLSFEKIQLTRRSTEIPVDL